DKAALVFHGIQPRPRVPALRAAAPRERGRIGAWLPECQPDRSAGILPGRGGGAFYSITDRTWVLSVSWKTNPIAVMSRLRASRRSILATTRRRRGAHGVPRSSDSSSTSRARNLRFLR